MDDIKATLLTDLLAAFDEAGLRQFCHQLGDIGYDDLAGRSRRSKMTHLIAYMERRGRRRRLVQLLTNLQPHLTHKYRAILHESDRFTAQAAAIDEALSWLEEIAAGEGAAIEDLPTMTWSTDELLIPHAEPESKLSWLDDLAQGAGPAVEEGPTMSWPDSKPGLPPALPYQIGGMITNPDYFFGRDEERRRLRSHLLDMGSSVVVGLPYIGKSSLLYALAHHEPLPPGHRFLLAYVDVVNGGFHHKPQPALLNAVWQQWVMQIGQPRRQASTPAVPEIKELADFARWVKALRGKAFRPVLCLDGFTQLAGERGPLDANLLSLWRDLGNDGQMAFVVTAAQPLSTLLATARFQSGFEAIFYQVEVGLLPERAARALLVEPARRHGVTIPPDLVERWLVYCGAYPIFLQMAGALLFEVLLENEQLDEAAEKALQRVFQNQAKPYWQQIWLSLSAEARQNFPRQPAVPQTPAERVVYRFLAGRGLLLVDGEQYRPFSPAFVQWLNLVHPLPRPQPATTDQPAAESEKANTGWLRRFWPKED
jgi:hypothetical protein